jgi:hypothetical protein
MLSPSQLEKTTFSFRKGYKAGYFGEPKQFTAPEGGFKPFGEFDYEEGYKAGQSDKKGNDAMIERLQGRRK